MGEELGGEHDAALWAAVVSGSTAAYSVLYQRYRSRVLGKARALTSDGDDAEDVVSTVFLEAWRRRADVRVVGGSLLPWLYTTTGFVAKNLGRSKRRHLIALAKLPPSLPQPDVAVTVLDCVDVIENRRALGMALARLQPDDRAVVQLCLVDELALSTVASTMGIPIGTVKSRLHRARGKLRRLLDRSLHNRAGEHP